MKGIFTCHGRKSTGLIKTLMMTEFHLAASFSGSLYRARSLNVTLSHGLLKHKLKKKHFLILLVTPVLFQLWQNQNLFRGKRPIVTIALSTWNDDWPLCTVSFQNQQSPSDKGLNCLILNWGYFAQKPTLYTQVEKGPWDGSITLRLVCVDPGLQTKKRL